MFDDRSSGSRVEEELQRLLDLGADGMTVVPADPSRPVEICWATSEWSARWAEIVGGVDGAGDESGAGPRDDVGPEDAVLAGFRAGLDADRDLLAAALAAQRAIGAAQAGQARALAAFAGRRPASLDLPDDVVGSQARDSRSRRPEALTPVSEFCVDEVAAALTLSGYRTEQLVTECLLLVERLPLVLAALEAGRICWEHVRVACDLLGGLSAELRERAQLELLDSAAGRTAQEWRPVVRRWVMRADADAITRRVADAVRGRQVVVHPGEDGMATLCATLPLPVARAVEDALRRYARSARTPGDERSAGERMADCLVSLVLDPGGHGMTPVQANLTVVAAVQTLLGGDEPGEVAGDVVPASVVRDLARALGLLPTGDDTVEATGTEATGTEAAGAEAAGAEAAGADVTEAGSIGSDGAEADCPATGGAPTESGPAEAAATESGPAETAATDGVDRPAAGCRSATDGRSALTDLLNTRTTGGTGLAGVPRVALTDDRTGELVALTDAAGIRRAVRAGTGLGPPPPTEGYRPGAVLDAFVRLRDRRCRFPGCRTRAGMCDVDHQHPWAQGGETAECNLACLCTHHHRLSHQAPGWRLCRSDDGAGLTWTTPTGQTITTRPPPLHPPTRGREGVPSARVDEPGAAGKASSGGSTGTATTSAVHRRDSIRGRPAPPRDHDDPDPPPF